MGKQASRIAKATLVTLAATAFAAYGVRDAYSDTAQATGQFRHKDIPEMTATVEQQAPSFLDSKLPRDLLKGVVKTIAARREERERAQALSTSITAEESQLKANRPIYS